MWRPGRMRAGPEPAVDILPRANDPWQDGSGLSPRPSLGSWVLDRAPLWSGAIVIVAAAIVLCGWVFAVPALTHILPVFDAMKPVTATCFVIMGVAVIGSSHAGTPSSGRLLTLVGAALLGAITLATLVAYAATASLFLGSVLDQAASAVPATFRLSATTAGAFLLLAVSLVLRVRRAPRTLAWSDASAAFTVFIALVSCVGYAYGAFARTTPALQNQGAFHTSILMLVSAGGVATLRPFGPVMRAFASEGPGGQLLRRMVPLYLALVIALGWLRLLGQRRGYYGLEVGLALMVVLAIALFAVMSWWTAAALERSARLHRRAEHALHESERALRVIVNATFDSILVSEGGVICEANAGSSTIFGFDIAELIGRPLVDLMAPESRLLVEAHTRADTQGSYEVIGIRKDGSRLQLEAVSRLHASPDGGRVIMALRDITTQRSLEAQFRQAQKMEAVGRLAGGVAHDFNNLLTIITSYTTFALQDVPPGDRRASDLEQILDAAGSAAGLTRQLLAFSRQQPMELKLLALNAVVAGAERMLARVIGEDVVLRTSLARDLHSIRADPGQVEQVIMNLAVNARDAMPDGGSLLIETSNAELDAIYGMRHDAVNPGTFVLLSVSDTGVGMDEETRQRIFEPFFTTKEMGKGTGLGLASVYGIVRQSGGHVWVYSEVGKGTTFKIYFPAVDADAEPLPPRGMARLDATGSETILLVEDSSQVRVAAREALVRAGYAVLEAADARQALRVGEGHPGRIHLLLTDVVMPGMSGRDLANALVALRPDLRVLLASGYTDEALRHHGMNDRGFALLQKPFTPDVLTRRVREALDAAENESMSYAPRADPPGDA